MNIIKFYVFVVKAINLNIGNHDAENNKPLLTITYPNIRVLFTCLKKYPNYLIFPYMLTPLLLQSSHLANPYQKCPSHRWERTVWKNIFPPTKPDLSETPAQSTNILFLRYVDLALSIFTHLYNIPVLNL